MKDLLEIRPVIRSNLSPTSSAEHVSLALENPFGLLSKRHIPAKKYKPVHFISGLRVLDLLALLAAGFMGYVLRFGNDIPLSEDSYLVIYLSVIVTFFSLNFANAYKERSISSLVASISCLFIGGVGAVFLLLVIGFISGTLRDYSRLWLLWSVSSAFIFLVANRIGITKIMTLAVKTNQLVESIVIVGANEQAEKMLGAIAKADSSKVSLLGIFDDRVRRPISQSLRPLVLGTTDELLEYVRAHQVDRVVVALPWVASDRINQILRKLRTVPVRIDLVPNDVIWQFPGVKMERLAGVPILTVANDRVDQQIGLLKRLEDITISSVLLTLASPVMFLVALAIKLDSSGPVFFKQKRHGYNNKIFDVYKFRSMKVDTSSSVEVKQATRNDDRITKLGKFLRRSSLDELPQLFNVLKGDMSIVGPRPHAVQHNVQYGGVISEYFARHNVKPGITGWAQVNGLRGETDTIEKMHRRVDADLYYIENWSLLLDLRIILMTAVTVWFQEQAY